MGRGALAGAQGCWGAGGAAAGNGRWSRREREREGEREGTPEVRPGSSPGRPQPAVGVEKRKMRGEGR